MVRQQAVVVNCINNSCYINLPIVNYNENGLWFCYSLQVSYPFLSIFPSSPNLARPMALDEALTSVNTRFSSSVQSPTVRIWRLRLSSPGAEVIENGCLDKCQCTCLMLWVVVHIPLRKNAQTYHSNGEIVGHFKNIYCPLLYLNPLGFEMIKLKTSPGSTETCKCQEQQLGWEGNSQVDLKPPKWPNHHHQQCGACWCNTRVGFGDLGRRVWVHPRIWQKGKLVLSERVTFRILTAYCPDRHVLRLLSAT